MNTKKRLPTKSLDGKKYKLSPERYRILPTFRSVNKNDRKYRPGTIVRLISTSDDRTPGDHRSDGWVNVCRIGTREAEFVGIPKKDLVPVRGLAITLSRLIPRRRA